MCHKIPKVYPGDLDVESFYPFKSLKSLSVQTGLHLDIQ